MPDYPNVVRMLAPPDHLRRVDIPEHLVPLKKQDGYKVDPFPDHRDKIARGIPDKHKGRVALVVASGPSTGLWGQAAIAKFVKKHKAVVWTTNNVFNVAGGLPVASDYHVILDDHFYAHHRSDMLRYLRDNPQCTLCACFEVPDDVQYFYMPISLGETADTRPEYNVGSYFHGMSSGVAAVQMAMQAGCDTIYLIGHDLTTFQGMTHGNGKRSDEELRANYPQSKAMRAGYALLADHARKLGVRIVNLSPISSIVDFEKEPVKFAN